MTAPPPVPDHRFIARLEPIDQRETGPAPRDGSWFITHPLGRPAGNTYTEVAFAEGVQAPREVLDAVVRAVAVELYGTAWAFTYDPTHPPQELARHVAGRRELVVVEAIEVFS